MKRQEIRDQNRRMMKRLEARKTNYPATGQARDRQRNELYIRNISHFKFKNYSQTQASLSVPP
jgi:hypothetical protein